MTFWFVSIALTAASLLAVLLPLLRTRSEEKDDSAFDAEVYRDQLDELDRDIERGVIDKDQAELARVEIARRLINADAELRKSQPVYESTNKTKSMGIAIAAILAIPLVGWGGYAILGSPGEPDQPLQERLARAPAASSIAELIARAERQLKENPGDVRGWDVLGPIYIATGRFDDSIIAYGNAIRLGGPTGSRESGLGEALVGKSGGLVTPDALNAFERSLAQEPGEPRARFYIATARAQKGDLTAAIALWDNLAKDLANDSPLKRAVLEAAEQSRARLARNQTAKVNPGPSREDVEAAASLDKNDRQAFIESMVAGLDEKLRENPNDIEGWKRLLRSYMVLNKPAEAASALERAREALGKGSEIARELEQFAQTVGIEKSAQ